MPSIIADPFFYFVAIPAVIFLGLSKGGFAGVGTAATPLLALYLPPLEAAALLLPVLITQDLISIYIYRRDWDAKNLKIMRQHFWCSIRDNGRRHPQPLHFADIARHRHQPFARDAQLFQRALDRKCSPARFHLPDIRRDAAGERREPRCHASRDQPGVAQEGGDGLVPVRVCRNWIRRWLRHAEIPSDAYETGYPASFSDPVKQIQHTQEIGARNCRGFRIDVTSSCDKPADTSLLHSA